MASPDKGRTQLSDGVNEEQNWKATSGIVYVRNMRIFATVYPWGNGASVTVRMQLDRSKL